MRAMLVRRLGSIDDLELGELPPPEMQAGHVRVAVKAAGVNFPDILMCEGKYQVKPPLPFVPGLEIAGEVMECAPGVEHVKAGDRVIAFARKGGGFAGQIVLPGGIVTPIPADIDFVEAAAFPVAYGTAHFALDYRGRLKAGETLLVTGATGGVGIAAIECGKMLGARVIAAAGGPEKLAVARAHGADDVVDYRAESLRDRVLALTGGKGVDVVFEAVGGQAFEDSVRALGWEGRLLVVGFASGDIPKVAANYILVKNISVVGVVFGEHSFRYPDQTRARLLALLDAKTAGKLHPRVHRSYPLAQLRDALVEVRSRRVVGKIVIEV